VSRAIRRAEPGDLGEIFTLQRAAFVDEAWVYETPFVPALEETYEAFAERMHGSTSWVATNNDRIVGAVSLRTCRIDTPDVERLMVAPDCRGQGIASVLLQAVEDAAREAGHRSLQLIVGDLATANRAIYAHLGWTEVASEHLEDFEHVVVHTMAKPL